MTTITVVDSTGHRMKRHIGVAWRLSLYRNASYMYTRIILKCLIMKIGS